MITYTSFDLGEVSQPTGTAIKRPWRDSNPRTRLRRPMLYPLSYRGWNGSGYRTAPWPHRPVPAGPGGVSLAGRSLRGPTRHRGSGPGP